MPLSHYLPLAARLRPQTLDEFIGQKHLIGEGKPLRQAILQGHLHSMIFWGPPGTGKTTLAKLIGQYAKAQIENLSAVTAGVKDIRHIVEKAKERLKENQTTILFLDEVHRFNKAQQDVLLPHVEEGLLTLIGATTENPSFELNNALLSRTRVYVLKRLDTADLLTIIEKAIQATQSSRSLNFPLPLREILAQAADGDARQLLNLLEILIDLAPHTDNEIIINEKILEETLNTTLRRFDKQGEYFYDQISALHKSMRGSSPDAALYWFCRMIDGGCDPRYIVRRLIRFASEDIGNADPRALQLALDAADTYERLGSPEGELTIAQTIIYCACCAKSNASYVAFQTAMMDARKLGTLEVPLHLRNAPTKLMKQLDYGKNYRYAHDGKDAYVAGENYFPEGMAPKQYYFPAERGLEIKIAEKLAELRKLDKAKNHS